MKMRGEKMKSRTETEGKDERKVLVDQHPL